MKYIYVCIVTILMTGVYWACSDDKAVFDVLADSECIRFQAIPGGAMMYYELPDNRDVFAILCRYKDCRGQDILKRSGYGGDSLLLDGFNQAETNIPVSVSLVNRQNEESEPIQMYFATEASAPYVFFDNARVASSWNGFQLMYTTPEIVSGMYHVFYVGINPMTQQQDTILVKSSPILQGGDTVLLALQQESPINTVVIRTEDHRGFRVKQEIWPDVEAYYPQKLKKEELEFIDVYGLNVKSEQDKLDIKYLFDGDVDGRQRLQGGKGTELYAFLAGPWAVGAPFIVDLKDNKIPAKVCVYAQLCNDLSYPRYNYVTGKTEGETGGIWLGRYDTKIPCDVTVYGSNNSDPESEDWIKLGEFKQEANITNTYFNMGQAAPESDCWATRCIFKNKYNYDFSTLLEAEPACLEIIFPALSNRYRYLKLVINDLFDSYTGAGDMNYSKYLTIQELEIYVKQE